MKLSERAVLHITEREVEERHNAFNKNANDQKRLVYWIGFIEGTLSSRGIEDGEDIALHAEAEKFAEFFDDPDASDLAEDIKARCHSSDEDLIDQLRQIIAERKREVAQAVASAETIEMNHFLGFCAGIICDGRVLQNEAEAILNRFRSSDILMNAPPFQQLRLSVEAAMADEHLTKDEADEVHDWIARLVGDGFVDTGIANIGHVAKLDEPITDHTAINFDDTVFVLTGPMRMGPRRFIESEIERVGGKTNKTVTKKTDYVVVSSTASRHWRTTHFGTKIERAKELIDEGYKLRFLSEIALEEAILRADQGGDD